MLSILAAAATWPAGVRWAHADSSYLRLPSGVLLEREEDELLLSTDGAWQLPEAVEQALYKGIAVHFVTEVQLLRKRWYWRNEVLLSSIRYQRLSYQALTHRWRLHTGNRPFDGLGLGAALGSSYADLPEALTALQRLARWRIGQRSALPTEGEAWLQLRFRIDQSQLPRPLQIGVLGRADWNLLVQDSHPLELAQL